MSRRTEKIESVLRQELGFLLAQLELPAITTVSKIEVAPDLKQARVGLTVLTDEEKVEQKVLDIVKKNIFDIQREVNQKFEMRNVPRVIFVLDRAEQYADRINKLLKQARE